MSNPGHKDNADPFPTLDLLQSQQPSMSPGSGEAMREAISAAVAKMRDTCTTFEQDEAIVLAAITPFLAQPATPPLTSGEAERLLAECVDVLQILVYAVNCGDVRVNHTYSAHLEMLNKIFEYQRKAPPLPSIGDGKDGDEYWRGYKARMEEMTVVQPEPAHPTLWRYLDNARKVGVHRFRLVCEVRPDGGFRFYIHPESVSGETEDYFIWPDPFNHHDMLVNIKDSPPLDVEGFKKLLAREFPSAQSPQARREEK